MKSSINSTYRVKAIEKGGKYGYLSVQQRMIHHRKSELSAVAIVAPSWESRSAHVLSAILGKVGLGIFLDFVEDGTLGFKPTNRSMMLAELKDRSRRISRIEGLRAIDYGNVVEAVIGVVRDEWNEKGPVDILMDVSCIPKAVAMAIAAESLKVGYTRNFSLLWTEGVYEKRAKKGSEPHGYKFSEGGWQAYLIPYLEGRSGMRMRRNVIATVGFESYETTRLIRKYEPDRLALIYAFPGASPEYSDLAKKEADRLARAVGASDALKVGIDLFDAVGVFEKISEIVRSEKWVDGENIIMALGPKTHAIGTLLAGLSINDLQIVTRRPQHFEERDTKAGKLVWEYEIGDLTAAESADLQ